MVWQMCACAVQTKRIGQTRQNEEDVPQKRMDKQNKAKQSNQKKTNEKKTKIGESNEKSELKIQYTDTNIHTHAMYAAKMQNPADNCA